MNQESREERKQNMIEFWKQISQSVYEAVIYCRGDTGVGFDCEY